MMCGVRSGQMSLVGLRDNKKTPHLYRRGVLILSQNNMNKTTFVEFFSAKINCLAGWAMGGVDVV